MKKIKLGLLVNNEERIKKYKEIPLSELSGEKALEIRKSIKIIENEILAFKEARDNYIRENGEETEDGSISILDPKDQQKAVEWINSLAETEIEVTWRPFLDKNTLDVATKKLQLTIRDLDLIDDLFLSPI